MGVWGLGFRAWGLRLKILHLRDFEECCPKLGEPFSGIPVVGIMGFGVYIGIPRQVLVNCPVMLFMIPDSLYNTKGPTTQIIRF